MPINICNRNFHYQRAKEASFIYYLKNVRNDRPEESDRQYQSDDHKLQNQ